MTTLYLQHYGVVILRMTDRREHLFKESGLPEAETSTNTPPSSKQHCITAFFMFYIEQNTNLYFLKLNKC